MPARHAPQRMQLKAVIKESHCSPVQDLAFHHNADPDCSNLFATVGKDQATVYDDSHMGGCVSVLANLALSSGQEEAKEELRACAWVNCAGASQHPYGDALLAVGGSGAWVHIISIAEAAVVAQLPVPLGTSVVELSATVEAPGLLLVLCKDGGMQLWHVPSVACLWASESDAFAAALHPQGSCIVTSSRAKAVSCWDLTALQLARAATPTPAAARPAGGAGDVTRTQLQLEAVSGSVVVCVRFLTAGCLALQAADGRMAVLEWPSRKVVSSWRVPGFSSSGSSTASHSSRCCFGYTPDGRHICVGNPSATAYVYEAATGSQVACVAAIRVTGPVRAAGMSSDGRHVLAAVGSGYVFRFEEKQRRQEGEEGEEEEAEEEEEEGADSDGSEDKE